ncbi:MAG TPA: methyltransferase domain-containing protein, partial [Bryobacterales bacterium]|nr:methyltransferase domain-containing protein [Bryobacterales bacterium]
HRGSGQQRRATGNIGALNRERSSLPFHLRALRAALRRMNAYLSRRYEAAAARANPMPLPERSAEFTAAEQQLHGLDHADQNARAYVEKHLPRLARTLELVPPARTSGRILELGCYLQITPFLAPFRGYREVRGAHQGAAGIRERKTASVHGRVFEVEVDLFDAERDRFPYDDGFFETVLACELIEHMIYDPMHLLLECRRVLEEGGRLVITTPNAGSLTSVARALHSYDNPQIHSQYTRPRPGAEPEVPHVREYTAFELEYALEAAGFAIETLVTEPIAELAMNLPMWNFLEANGYNTSRRGEQAYAVAVKRSILPVTRYPRFLYSD